MSVLLASIVVITNIGFTVGYDTKAVSPSWVAYDLEPCEVMKAPRPSYGFRKDPRLCGADSRSEHFPYDVIHGYDRGHLAPAADFNWDTNALKQTFLFSNVSPMTSRLNRGEWKRTEDEVRRLATSGTVHVVVWPELPKLSGYDGPLVPTAFHKIAYGWFGVRYWYLQNMIIDASTENK